MTFRRTLTALAAAALFAAAPLALAHHGTRTSVEETGATYCTQSVDYGHEEDTTLSCTFPCRIGDRLTIYGRVDVDWENRHPTITGTAACGGHTVTCTQREKDYYWGNCDGEGQPAAGLVPTQGVWAEGTCTIKTTVPYYIDMGYYCSSAGRKCEPPLQCRPPIIILPPDAEEILDGIIQW